MKYFNVAGPCIEGKHYMLDATERLHNELVELINNEQYFVIHAARQTGKTTLLLNLRDRINAEGKYFKSDLLVFTASSISRTPGNTCCIILSSTSLTNDLFHTEVFILPAILVKEL